MEWCLTRMKLLAMRPSVDDRDGVRRNADHSQGPFEGEADCPNFGPGGAGSVEAVQHAGLRSSPGALQRVAPAPRSLSDVHPGAVESHDTTAMGFPGGGHLPLGCRRFSASVGFPAAAPHEQHDD
jgi:hypothetical protein